MNWTQSLMALGVQCALPALGAHHVAAWIPPCPDLADHTPILIATPYGFGKTSIVHAWCWQWQADGWVVLWITTVAQWQQIMTHISAFPASHVSPSVILACDTHDPLLHHALAHSIAQLPSQWRVIATSRTADRWRAIPHRLIDTLTIVAHFQHAIKDSGDHRLCDADYGIAYGGWAIALTLLRSAPATMPRSWLQYQIHRSVQTHVLAVSDTTARRLLMMTTALPFLHADLWDLLFEADDRVWFRTLCETYLGFLIPGVRAGSWEYQPFFRDAVMDDPAYRYHHPFSHQQLAQAAHWYAATHAYPAAITVALTLHDVPHAAAWIACYAETAFTDGQASVICAWFRTSPALLNDPQCRILSIWSSFLCHDHRLTQHWLYVLCTEATQLTDAERVQLAIFQAHYATLTAHGHRAIAFAAESLRHLDRQSLDLHAVVWRFFAVSTYQKTVLTQALMAAQQAIRASHAADDQQGALMSRLLLAHVAYDQGKFAQADHEAETVALHPASQRLMVLEARLMQARIRLVWHDDQQYDHLLQSLADTSREEPLIAAWVRFYQCERAIEHLKDQPIPVPTDADHTLWTTDGRLADAWTVLQVRSALDRGDQRWLAQWYQRKTPQTDGVLTEWSFRTTVTYYWTQWVLGDRSGAIDQLCAFYQQLDPRDLPLWWIEGSVALLAMGLSPMHPLADTCRAALQQATHLGYDRAVRMLPRACRARWAQAAWGLPIASNGLPALPQLTRRESDILRLMAQGISNQGIASTLVITVGTVKSYSRTLFHKLGVHTRTHAIVQARAYGLLDS